MKYFTIKTLKGGDLYYKFDGNQAYVRSDEHPAWQKSGLYSNEVHFRRWANMSKRKFTELTEAEMFALML